MGIVFVACNQADSSFLYWKYFATLKTPAENGILQMGKNKRIVKKFKYGLGKEMF